MSLTELKNETMRVWTDMQSRIDTIEQEQKRLHESTISQTGAVPGEYKQAIDRLNADINLLMGQVKQLLIEQKRPMLTPGNTQQSDATKAFLKAVRHSGDLTQLSPDELKHVSYNHMPQEQKALYAGDATSGGFFASMEFINQLQQYMLLISPMRSISQVVQTSGEKVEMPNLINDTSAYWAVEQQSFTDSADPSLGMLNIPVHEARGLVKLSQQNIEDSMFNLEQFLVKRLGLKFAQLEGAGFINGNGNGKPRGILSYPIVASASFAGGSAGKNTGVTSIPYVPSTNATLLTPDCLITILHDLKSGYRNSATWVLTTTTLGVIRLFKDSQNRPLWQPFAAGGLPSAIYDRPYVEMPDMPEIGAGTFPILLGDFSNYMIVDRVGLNMKQLNELFAISGLVAYLARERVGGDVLLPEAFRALKIAVS